MSSNTIHLKTVIVDMLHSLHDSSLEMMLKTEQLLKLFGEDMTWYEDWRKRHDQETNTKIVELRECNFFGFVTEKPCRKVLEHYELDLQERLPGLSSLCDTCPFFEKKPLVLVNKDANTKPESGK